MRIRWSISILVFSLCLVTIFSSLETNIALYTVECCDLQEIQGHGLANEEFESENETLQQLILYSNCQTPKFSFSQSKILTSPHFKTKKLISKFWRPPKKTSPVLI